MSVSCRVVDYLKLITVLPGFLAGRNESTKPPEPMGDQNVKGGGESQALHQNCINWELCINGRHMIRDKINVWPQLHIRLGVISKEE